MKIQPNPLIRIRIETLLNERGLKWSEIYQKAGLGKTQGSLILNGFRIPPKWLRIKIAEVFNVDSITI